jgi:hypothetical protein
MSLKEDITRVDVGMLAFVDSVVCRYLRNENIERHWVGPDKG